MITARNARLLLGGRDLSGRSNNITLDLTAETPDATTFACNTKENLANGIQANELTADGFYATGASELDADLGSLQGQSVLTGFYPYLYSASQIGYEFTGILNKYNMKFTPNDAAGMSLTVTAGSGQVLRSQSLAGVTINGTGTSNLSSVDFSGSSGNSYGTIRVLTLTGTTPIFSASVQNSNNDSVFTTIYTATCIVPAHLGPVIGACLTSNLISASRYRRVTLQLSGTSPCATFIITSAS